MKNENEQLKVKNWNEIRKVKSKTEKKMENMK